MVTSRQKFGSLLLGLPGPLRSLRNIPILGGLVHRLSYRLLPVNEKVWARVENGPGKGLWLELNPRTGQQYLHGEVETAVQNILEKKLKPGMVFYDLGANIGFFSLLASRLVGPAGKVYSFEPDREVADRLRRNVAKNACANVTVIEAGIWSTSGNVNFLTADPSSPDRGVGKFISGDDHAQGTPTRCVSLDDFIRSAPGPDAIKCDVEGAEVEALRGAQKLIEDCHPWILCEMHSDANDKFVRKFLGDRHYDTESLDELHILATPHSAKE